MNDIGQLAAVIAIRTILNYFLLRDIAVASVPVAESKGVATSDRGDTG